MKLAIQWLLALAAFTLGTITMWTIIWNHPAIAGSLGAVAILLYTIKAIR